MSRGAKRWNVRTTRTYPCAFCRETGHHISQCQLANTECKYCHQLGHTTRRCPKIPEQKRRVKQQYRRRLHAAVWGEQAEEAAKNGWNVVTTSSRRKTKTTQPEIRVQQSKYAALEQEDDETTNDLLRSPLLQRLRVHGQKA